MKKVLKTESVAEFLARGGKVNKIPVGVNRYTIARKEATKAKRASEVDMSALPEALRLKYGVKQ